MVENISDPLLLLSHEEQTRRSQRKQKRTVSVFLQRQKCRREGRLFDVLSETCFCLMSDRPLRWILNRWRGILGNYVRGGWKADYVALSGGWSLQSALRGLGVQDWITTDWSVQYVRCPSSKMSEGELKDWNLEKMKESGGVLSWIVH